MACSQAHAIAILKRPSSGKSSMGRPADTDGAQHPGAQKCSGISLPCGRPLYPFHERAFPIVVYHPDKEALGPGVGRTMEEESHTPKRSARTERRHSLPSRLFPFRVLSDMSSRRRCCDTFYTSLMVVLLWHTRPDLLSTQKWIFFKALFCHRLRAAQATPAITSLATIKVCERCTVSKNDLLTIFSRNCLDNCLHPYHICLLLLNTNHRQ